MDMKKLVMAFGACGLLFVALAPFTRGRHAPWRSGAHSDSSTAAEAKRPISFSRTPSESHAPLRMARDRQSAPNHDPVSTGSTNNKVVVTPQRAMSVAFSNGAVRVAQKSHATNRASRTP